MNGLRKKISARLKAVGNLLSFYKFYLSKPKSDVQQFEKYVILNVKNTVIERVYAHILFAMQVNGYKIYLVNNPRLFANIIEYPAQIASLPNLTIVDNVNNVSHEALYIYDFDLQDETRFNKVKLQESILTNSNKRNLNIMPFPMIPRNYFSGNYRNAEKLRDGRRNIGIYFSGNSEPKVYDHPIYRNFLRLMSRTSVIDAVKRMLLPNELSIVTQQDQMAVDTDLTEKFVLYEWVRSREGIIVGNRTSNEDWFVQLAKCNFFLGCPGYIQPLCHNLVEAMSVGTIPILEYGDYLNPTLEDGVNCISFSGEEDLIKKIRQALRMTDEEIARMRNNVIKYYDQHLSLTAVCSFLEKSARSNQNVDLITSYNYEKQWNMGCLNT
ncbi:glycosyltransferase [Hymenobacter sp. DG25A]|uniref:glycosyltransferase n=1 Tax=Hymenobacter sp. DG25A TaxID=1385663 RepID=UPI0006BC134C|nr:glycosyltransferase [Hymenobacter sp. DG25A]ALD21556.1 hypothetical protein AM218_10480 [Hymenobacter sp. DG25A]